MNCCKLHLYAFHALFFFLFFLRKCSILNWIKVGCQFSTSYFDGGKGTCTIVSSVLSLFLFGNIASFLFSPCR